MKLNARIGMGIILAMTGLAMSKAATAGETSWSCWQSNTDIHCIPGFMFSKTTGTTTPLSLNKYAQAGYFEEEDWVVIPMHTHPTDWSFVELLVKSIMCGNKIGCTVEVNRTPMNAALLGLDG